MVNESILNTKRKWQKVKRSISRFEAIRIIQSVNSRHPAGVSEKGMAAAKSFGICLGLAGLMFISSCIHPMPAHSAEHISTRDAVHAIIGEAENQGYVGMLAVACAIRNRGTLKGVYGLHAKRVVNHKYSVKTEDMAIKAWAEANIHDITKGATGWGNADDLDQFAQCKWWRNCSITFMYKDHWFYRRAI